MNWHRSSECRDPASSEGQSSSRPQDPAEVTNLDPERWCAHPGLRVATRAWACSLTSLAVSDNPELAALMSDARSPLIKP